MEKTIRLENMNIKQLLEKFIQDYTDQITKLNVKKDISLIDLNAPYEMYGSKQEHKKAKPDKNSKI